MQPFEYKDLSEKTAVKLMKNLERLNNIVELLAKEFDELFESHNALVAKHNSLTTMVHDWQNTFLSSPSNGE